MREIPPPCVFRPVSIHKNHPRCPIVLFFPLPLLLIIMEKPSLMNTLRELDEEASLSRSQETRETKELDVLDSQNPQHWSSTRKTLLFVSLMSSSLLADGYGISASPSSDGQLTGWQGNGLGIHVDHPASDGLENQHRPLGHEHELWHSAPGLRWGLCCPPHRGLWQVRAILLL